MERKPTHKRESVNEGESPSKRHKKHKKHKQRKKSKDGERETKHDVKIKEEVILNVNDDIIDDSDQEEEEDAKPIKLKIKFGAFPKKGERDIKERDIEPSPDSLQKHKEGRSKRDKIVDVSKTWKAKDDVFRTKRSDEDTSDEEQQWLDALEKGTLDDKGEVKRSKDIKLMTARQRALIHGIKEEPLMQLPTGYKPAEVTEEQIKKRLQKAKQRRELAAKKQEKDKKQTLARLLTKQDSKAKGVSPKSRGATRGRLKTPSLRYVQKQSGNFICLPEGRAFPMQPASAKPAPEIRLCGVSGCGNQRKYTCSKTGVPLCSLQCYKLNLQSASSPKRST